MLATVASHGLNSALYAAEPRPAQGLRAHRHDHHLAQRAAGARGLAAALGQRSAGGGARQAGPAQLRLGRRGLQPALAGASFKQLTGVDVTHIPYKGTAPAMTDLMAGRVDFVLTTGAIPFIRSGKLRALAVASRQRLPALPDAFEEAGVKGFYTDSWYGLVAPAGTPRAALERLNGALATALRNPEVQKQFIDQGSLPVKPMGVDAFWRFVREQMPVAAEQVRVSGARAE
jgi:tripartite-type tricarboxylate transporter receptor subunit TctC